MPESMVVTAKMASDPMNHVQLVALYRPLMVVPWVSFLTSFLVLSMSAVLPFAPYCGFMKILFELPSLLGYATSHAPDAGDRLYVNATLTNALLCAPFCSVFLSFRSLACLLCVMISGPLKGGFGSQRGIVVMIKEEKGSGIF